MAIIALISCTKSKMDYPCAAKELYSKSSLFRRSYELSSLTSDKIFILSAKYGLIPDSEHIEPYDETLNNKNTEQRKKWANNVIGKLEDSADVKHDYFIILAGKNYYEYLLPYLNNYWLPLEGLGMGKSLSELIKLIELEKSNNHAYVLHKLFNGLPRYNWRDIDKVPFDNGIYIMFEAGEEYMGMDRITRVGTHQSQDRLKLRLKNHFLVSNKDGSIFRKNIGRALLNKEQSSYLDIWNLNLSKAENKEKHESLVDYKLQEEIESAVSNYLKVNFTFACLPFEEANDRKRFEEGIIATLNSEGSFAPGGGWFGANSPIRCYS